MNWAAVYWHPWLGIAPRHRKLEFNKSPSLKEKKLMGCK